MTFDLNIYKKNYSSRGTYPNKKPIDVIPGDYAYLKFHPTVVTEMRRLVQTYSHTHTFAFIMLVLFFISQDRTST